MELSVISHNDTLEEITIIHSQTAHSDDDFDDELGIPQSLTLITVEGTPVAIEKLDEGDSVPTSDIIPFSAIHRPIKFKSFHRNIFIPGVDIKVKITGSERNLTTHFINPNLYTISLTHGNFTWVIKKRYKHIHHLHQQLILFRTALNIPFPTKTHRERRDTFKNNAVRTKEGKHKASLPRFPKKPEVLIAYDRLPNRINQLEDYLNNLLAISIYRNHPETIRFLEASHLSFIYDLGFKGKEGMVRKRSGNSRAGCNCLGCFTTFFLCVRCRHLCKDLICSSFNERWFFIKDQCFGYVNPNTGRIGAVMLFDQGFEVSSGMYSTGWQKGIQVLTLSQQIIIKCWTKRNAKQWIQALKDVANNQARDFTQNNPRQSFAPIRSNITACWFVDGAGYMAAVANAIEAAKEEVFIADWWLSPEIYLKRPALYGDYWRLDKLLQRKAKQGIKIFILLYKELEMALGINSYYSKQRLISDSNDNIKVLRYPDHAKVGVFLWAHHEKLVIVDQIFAFLGGIDLCYGRWDDFRHRLTDLGSISSINDIATLNKKNSSAASGDTIYRNSTSYSISDQPLPIITETLSSNPPSTIPQLLSGDNLLMSNSQHTENIKRNTPEMERKNLFDVVKKSIKMMYNPHEISNMNGINKENSLSEANDDLVKSLDGSARFWIGKDYVNFIVKDFTDLDAPFDDFIDRSTTPRMPWHDIGMCVQNASAKDISRHFIQRWNAVKLEKARFNNVYPYLLPKSYNDCNTRTAVLPRENECHRVTCQVLRSVSAWSCGFLESDTVEESIHEAYIDTITRSQHYIYIENQFFISLQHGNIYTKNQIGDALYNRILRAHKDNAVFRVFVVMPLLPGFEGEVGESSGASLHAITHWNYDSISRGKDALLNRLKTAGIENPSEYITFYGLRTHSVLNEEPITELIYVHSKLMIVDDKTVICGSANINDRSLIGKRDSEIAVIIEDEEFEDGVMNGDSFPCGMFSGSLRKRLFKEHLGILGKEDESIVIDIQDPVCENFYINVWFETAMKNTEVYEKVFHCIPSDEVVSFAALRRYQEEKPLYTTEPNVAEEMLNSIQGHLVLLPLKFMSKENLMPTAACVEGMMPTSLWT